VRRKGMAIFQTAEYQVNSAAVPAVKRAIEEFVEYVRANEPGTLVYAAWQRQDDPTRFLHLFTFADAAAQTAHSESTAVARFEATYRPELVGGDVVFTCAGRDERNLNPSVTFANPEGGAAVVP
jgi:quinol monooxygenase YgiN